MLRILLLLLVLTCAVEAFIHALDPVRLPLYMHQYVSVHVGNPGRDLRLRLRFDLDGVYLYDDPKSYSDTFAEPPESSDIFYLSKVKIRLPVLYGYEFDVRSDTS